MEKHLNGRKFHNWLVVEPPHLKKYAQNGFIFPNCRGENEKMFETTT